MICHWGIRWERNSGRTGVVTGIPTREIARMGRAILKADKPHGKFTVVKRQPDGTWKSA